MPSAEGLHVELESELPPSLPAGSETSVFCFGTCFHAREPVVGLHLIVGDAHHRPTALRMPRRDVAVAHPSSPHSYRSGFWATVPVSMRGRPGDAVGLHLAVTLRDGTERIVALGSITIGPQAHTCDAPAAGPAIAICMATHEPDLALFAGQVQSLRAQTERDWICVVSDDCSSAPVYDEIARLLAGDLRFVLSRSERRLGFYRNFERALALAPADVEAVALCDQDDHWHPEKLERLREALGSAQLAFCDLRLVDAGGRVLRDTLWEGRRNNHSDLASLLVANSIPGAAMLFRRALVELALPFPDPPGVPFHDHWLALVALASGEIAYVDRPLYDYMRHGGAVLGSAGAPSARRGRWRAAYFFGYEARAVMAETLLERGAPADAGRRRALQRFLDSATNPAAFAWLATRELSHRRETLGGERALAQGIAWRWLVAAGARVSHRCDASLPGVGGFEQPRLRRWIGGA